MPDTPVREHSCDNLNYRVHRHENVA
jgi:hypothetical protein